MIDPTVTVELAVIGTSIIAEMIIGFLDICALTVEQQRVLAEAVIASTDPVMYFREVI